MSEFRSLHFLHGLGAVTGRALRAAALRCELRAASCCAALLGVGGPEWHARDGQPRGGETLLTRSRGGPGHGTLRWTRTSKQAGKALRSQGCHYARVM